MSDDKDKRERMTEEEFVTQYVLNRVLGNISGLEGVACATEGRAAYRWISSNTRKVNDDSIELHVLKLKAAAFDAFVKKFELDSEFIGPRLVSLNEDFRRGAFYDNVVQAEIRYVWKLDVSLDSPDQIKRPSLEQALFSLIPRDIKNKLKVENDDIE